MSVLTLTVESRDANGEKAKNVRRTGLIPAVIYGKGIESKTVKMNYQDFRRLYREAGDSTLIELDIDGKGKDTVLVHDYQLDPVTDEFIHVDFLHVNMKEEITANVHLEFVGVAPAVKDLGGILSIARNELEIKCLPKDIPHHLEVDISILDDFHKAVHVSDLNIPEGVVVTADAALTLATVAQTRSEKGDAADEGEGGEAAESSEEKSE